MKATPKTKGPLWRERHLSVAPALHCLRSRPPPPRGAPPSPARSEARSFSAPPTHRKEYPCCPIGHLSLTIGAMSIINNEWNQFKVGTPSKRCGCANNDCVQFSEISHVSHVSSSIEILKDEKIKAGLVFDKSRLNDARILVTWFSPNHWADGFRYGTIKFKFALADIIKKKNFYWIESIAYGIPACRILVTEKNHPKLVIYDPEIGDGPWWYDKANDKHYYNNDYCLEFMVEQDISIADSPAIDFVSHHGKWCSLNRRNPAACPELNMPAQQSAALFIASVIAQSLKLRQDIFLNGHDKGNEIPSSIMMGWGGLFIWLIEKNAQIYRGALRHNDQQAPALARAICNIYVTKGINDECLQLMAFYKDKSNFMISLAKHVAHYFGLTSWEPLIN